MGYSEYSLDTRAATRSLKTEACMAKGYKDTFTHDTDIRTGRTAAAAAHELLDPKKMRDGRRESRDSAEHPESVGVVVGTDVTGSFSTLPKQIVGKVPSILGAIIKNGALDHPQLCFTAIGDVECDRVPLQVGQFDTGTEVEDNIDKFFLEGGGGGNSHESYDLWFYFLARCTSMDCLEKRGKKGYAFLIEDEPFSGQVRKQDVKDVFGQDIQGNIPIKNIVNEALEKFEIYVIRPRSVAWGKDPRISQAWEDLLPGRIIPVQEVESIAEVIALQIAANEGVDLDAVAKSFDKTTDSAALAVIERNAKTKGIVAKAEGTIVQAEKTGERL